MYGILLIWNQGALAFAYPPKKKAKSARKALAACTEQLYVVHAHHTCEVIRFLASTNDSLGVKPEGPNSLISYAHTVQCRQPNE
ncbi:hypothetical protein BU24DRAFT_417333 [Aaosphaeria arxii CBS 175.79]|uniref:Uncharacterized protein n=1 Tax=Aaosphaeria arxii CBS 175.79 TaxID=1450172 RepID=A0A6A5YA72_9PLEO|nr:uncharacterized protein BU24DRAFT_417333 [Aaosphaeria arxii CBS 175.79]KAF2021700.1 hypothetical protein BU24DRAFT_417333 [Aaosphaeria arxii CBS 175.79]